MHLLSWLSLFVSVVFPVLAQEPPKELIVETTYTPEECSVLAKTGDSIRVHYVCPVFCSRKAVWNCSCKTGTLFSNGNKFDSRCVNPESMSLLLSGFISLDRNSPLPLTLGVGQVIQGWDEGLQGMCVNEKRKLTIPSNKAYGVQKLLIAPTKPVLMLFWQVREDSVASSLQIPLSYLMSSLLVWIPRRAVKNSDGLLYLVYILVHMFAYRIHVPIMVTQVVRGSEREIRRGSLVMAAIFGTPYYVRTWALKFTARFSASKAMLSLPISRTKRDLRTFELSK